VICLWRRRLGRCRRPRTSRRQELDEALREAQEAVALAPDAIQTQLERTGITVVVGTATEDRPYNDVVEVTIMAAVAP